MNVSKELAKCGMAAFACNLGSLRQDWEGEDSIGWLVRPCYKAK